MLKIRRRISDIPCMADKSCPDCFELEDGSFAILGADVTDELRHSLVDGASCNEGERIVMIPRSLMEAVINELKQ